jgi:hypothetical protein
VHKVGKNSITITVFVSLLVLLFEYLIIQPLVGSMGGLLILVVTLTVFLTYEYYSNTFFPKLGFTKFRDYVDILIGVISKFLYRILSIVMVTAKELAKLLAYGLVIFSFVLTFFFNFFFQYLELNIKVIQGWTTTTIPTNILISIIFIAVYLFIMLLLGSLESSFSKISRLVVTACAAVLILNTSVPHLVTGYDLSIEQTILMLAAITFAIIWGVAWIIIDRHNKQYKKLDDTIAFLSNIPQISDWVTQGSLRLTNQLQQGWLQFINDPWADGYIDSIKNCVPVKCDGYLLTIGYVTSLEARILEDVKNALEL